MKDSLFSRPLARVGLAILRIAPVLFLFSGGARDAADARPKPPSPGALPIPERRPLTDLLPDPPPDFDTVKAAHFYRHWLRENAVAGQTCFFNRCDPSLVVQWMRSPEKSYGATCGVFSATLDAVYRAAGLESRVTHALSPSPDGQGFASHTTVGVYDPARGRWFLEDPLYDGYWAAEEGGYPVSAADLQLALFDGDRSRWRFWPDLRGASPEDVAFRAAGGEMLTRYRWLLVSLPADYDGAQTPAELLARQRFRLNQVVNPRAFPPARGEIFAAYAERRGTIPSILLDEAYGSPDAWRTAAVAAGAP